MNRMGGSGFSLGQWVTSIEVAIKMAFRKYIVDHGLDHGLGDPSTIGGRQEQLKVW